MLLRCASAAGSSFDSRVDKVAASGVPEATERVTPFGK